MPSPRSRALRDHVVHVLAQLGFDPVRLPGRRHLFEITDEQTRQRVSSHVRTAPNGSLLSPAHGPNPADPDAPIRIADGDPAFIIIGVSDRNGRAPEVYRVPTSRVVRDMQENHRAFAATHPEANELRALAFDGNPDTPGRGFRVKYAEFRLDAPPAASAESEVREQSPLERALQEVGRCAVAEFGQPPQAIRISIGVMFRTGEMVLHWRPTTS